MIHQIEIKCTGCRQKYYSPREDATHAKCLITLPIVAQVADVSKRSLNVEDPPYQRITEPEGVSVAESHPYTLSETEVIKITVPEKKLKKITDLKATKKLEYNRRRNAALRRIAKESLGGL